MYLWAVPVIQLYMQDARLPTLSFALSQIIMKITVYNQNKTVKANA